MRDEAEPPVNSLPPGTAIIHGDLAPDSAIRAFVTELAAEGGAAIVTDLTGKEEVGDEGLPVEMMIKPVIRSYN